MNALRLASEFSNDIRRAAQKESEDVNKRYREKIDAVLEFLDCEYCWSHGSGIGKHIDTHVKNPRQNRLLHSWRSEMEFAYEHFEEVLNSLDRVRDERKAEVQRSRAELLREETPNA